MSARDGSLEAAASVAGRAVRRSRAVAGAARRDVFSLDSALRPAKLAVLLEAAAGRRTVVELGTGTAWATIALAIADPRAHDRELGSGRARAARAATWTSPARTCAGGSRSSKGWGRTGPAPSPASTCSSSTARTSASRRSPRSRPGAPSLAPGALVVFDDYGHPDYPGVAEAVAELGAAGEARALAASSGRRPEPRRHSSRRNASTPPPSTSRTPASASAYAPAPASRCPRSGARRRGRCRRRPAGRRARRCRRSRAPRRRSRPPRRRSRARAAGSSRTASSASASSAGPWRSQPRAVERRTARARRSRCAAPEGRWPRAPRALPRAPPRRPRGAPLAAPRETGDCGPLTAAIIVDPARGAAHARVPPESSPLTDGSFEHIAPRPG